MRKISLTGALLLIFIMLFSPNILAQNKAKTPVIKLPVFMAGKDQMVDKPIEGDLMVAGDPVRIVSNVTGDAYVAGSQVDIGGTISGNLIVVGGNVTISGKINKNLIVAGGQVTIDNSADIGGYVLAAGKEVRVLGHFSGPVKIGAENLVVGEKAVVEGDLEADIATSSISTTAKIAGEKKIQIHEIKEPKKQLTEWQQFSHIEKILEFLGELVVLLVLVKLFDKKKKQIDIKSSFWSLAGMGLVALIVTPFLALLLMMTVIGIPLALIILGLYVVSLYLSGIVAALLTGELVLKDKNSYFQGLVGLLLLTIVGLIPVVGCLIELVVLVVGMGIIFKNTQEYLSAK